MFVPETEQPQHGADYDLYIDDGDVDLVDHEYSSNDPRDKLWSYFREDILFHVFHTMFHKLLARMQESPSFGRASEMFFFTHAQIVKRAAVERALVGLPDLVPLNFNSKDHYGPGYKEGYFAWQGLGGRRDDCVLSSSNREKMKKRLKKVMSEMKYKPDLESWYEGQMKNYHGYGHYYIAKVILISDWLTPY